MKKSICLVFIALLNSFTYAKPVLVMGDNVKVKLSKYDSEESQYLKRIDTSKRMSSLVEIDLLSKMTILDMKNHLEKMYSVSDYGDNSIKFKKEGLKVDISDYNSDLFLCAKKILTTVMPIDYINQFMFISVDVQRSVSRSLGVNDEGYVFNYKRVFNDRVVRNNENYLKIHVKSNGSVDCAYVAMQDLKNITEKADADSDYNEMLATLDSLLNRNFEYAYVYDEAGAEIKEKIEKVETGSVANAYCEIIDEQKKKLFPCLSYSAKISLSKNRKFDYIIDVPHSRKSWSDYYEKKKSVLFDSSRL